MNKEPKEVDWSKQKPGTIGVTRWGHQFEFIASRGIEAVFYNEHKGWATKTFWGRKWPDKELPDDILLPWESCIAEGHNPDGLTNAQVGEGWRLLGSHDENVNPLAEVWDKQWRSRGDMRTVTYCPPSTYRVPITKAKRRVPCGPEHFPPGTVVHAGNPLCHHPVGVYSGGIRCLDVGHLYDWSQFLTEGYALWRRSTDFGKTWLPCFIETEE